MEIAWRRPTLAGAKPRLPLALKSLTSVFGMGTGVTSSPKPPDNFVVPSIQGQDILYNPYKKKSRVNLKKLIYLQN